MHYYDVLIIVTSVLVNAYGWAMVAEKLKKSRYTSTVTVGKATEDGEQVSVMFNLSADDSPSAVDAKLAAAYQIGDARRAFIHNRFQEKLKEAQAEKAASKLKAVNDEESS